MKDIRVWMGKKYNYLRSFHWIQSLCNAKKIISSTTRNIKLLLSISVHQFFFIFMNRFWSVIKFLFFFKFFSSDIIFAWLKKCHQCQCNKQERVNAPEQKNLLHSRKYVVYIEFILWRRSFTCYSPLLSHLLSTTDVPCRGS